MIYYCNDCHEFFSDREVKAVCIAEQTWDSPAEYEEYCPICGSEDFEESNTCDFCGGPVSPHKKICFCDDCEQYLDDQFIRFTRKMAVENNLKPTKARTAMMEFLAEKY